MESGLVTMTDQALVNVNSGDTEVEKTEVEPVAHPKEKRMGKEEQMKKYHNMFHGPQVIKDLCEPCTPPEGQLSQVKKKYTELFHENRTLQAILKQCEKKMLLLQREKVQLQNEKSKALLTRAKLESLCRELQKQNKTIKEESLLTIREQEQVRRKLSEQVHGNIATLTNMMNSNIDKKSKMCEEYNKMTKRFETVHEEVKSKQMEVQLAYNLMKVTLEERQEDLAKVTEENKNLQTDKKDLLLKVAELQGQVKDMQETEIDLRNQICNLYTEKNEVFRKTVHRTDKISGEFKEEMSLMSTKVCLLEQETSLWKKRWEIMHDKMVQMAADKQARDTELTALKMKLSLLQELVKVFQRERALFPELKKKSGTGKKKEGKKKKNIVKEDSSCVVPSIKAAQDQNNDKVVDQVVNPSKDCDNSGDSFGTNQVSEIIETQVNQQSTDDTNEEQAIELSKEEEETSKATSEKDTNSEEAGETVAGNSSESVVGEKNINQEADSSSLIVATEATTAEIVEKKNDEDLTNSSSTKEETSKSEENESFQYDEAAEDAKTETVLEQLYETIGSMQTANSDALQKALTNANELWQLDKDSFTSLHHAVENDLNLCTVNKDKQVAAANKRIQDNKDSQDASCAAGNQGTTKTSIDVNSKSSHTSTGKKSASKKGKKKKK